MRRLIVSALAAASLLLAVAARAAEVTEVAGVKYDNSVPLAGTPLVLNGAGIRYKAIFKVYTAGLYLSAKATTPDAVFAARGPKRMHVVMLREINSDELGKLFTRGMEQNSSRDEFSKMIPGVIKLSEVFSAHKRLMPGDSFSIDYVPAVGSVIAVNGKVVSDAIKEPEFFNALMKIWLGRSPADAQLKELLLGHGPKDNFN